MIRKHIIDNKQEVNMRLATFNIENMFERAKCMNLDKWKDGEKSLQDFMQLTELIQEATYTDEIKSKILNIMRRQDGLLTNGNSEYIVLQDLRGKFLYKPKGKPVEIGASGRNDWIGWFELAKEPIDEVATENTARIIGEIKADVQCVIEAESRPALKHFNEVVLGKVNIEPFEHIMLIDGNDERGIDIGIMAKLDYSIVRILSHIDDKDAKGTIFSRDCAEYEIKTPNGNTLLLLLNHFKSKGYGNSDESAAKRLRQATRVRQIYDEYLSKGYEYLAVLGDLNENPDESPMDPLIRQESNLTDIMVHPKFVGDGRPGTHGNGTKDSKLDYILMSPKLSDKVINGGIERSGVWGGKNGTLFPHLPTITSSTEAASDHAGLWVDLDI
jgi:endonuclease/exonuclease/phosphatase family metal-dependent hydrolase